MGIETVFSPALLASTTFRLNGLGSPMGIETSLSFRSTHSALLAKWPGKPDGD